MAKSRQKHQKQCVGCGKTYTFNAFESEVGSRLYCSRQCANVSNAEGLSKSRCGEGNPMYGVVSWNRKQRTLSSDGYYLVVIDKKRVREHRYIMECHKGGQLGINEDVHHIDGDRLNNDINNLVVMNHGEHSKLHQSMKVGG